MKCFRNKWEMKSFSKISWKFAYYLIKTVPIISDFFLNNVRFTYLSLGAWLGKFCNPGGLRPILQQKIYTYFCMYDMYVVCMYAPFLRRNGWTNRLKFFEVTPLVHKLVWWRVKNKKKQPQINNARNKRKIFSASSKYFILAINLKQSAAKSLYVFFF